MKLTKDDFIIEDGYIQAISDTMIDEILKNQKMCEYYQKFDTEQDMLKVLEDAEKCSEWMEIALQNNIIIERLKDWREKEQESLDKDGGHLIMTLEEYQRILEGKE